MATKNEDPNIIECETRSNGSRLLQLKENGWVAFRVTYFPKRRKANWWERDQFDRRTFNRTWTIRDIAEEEVIDLLRARYSPLLHIRVKEVEK